MRPTSGESVYQLEEGDFAWSVDQDCRYVLLQQSALLQSNAEKSDILKLSAGNAWLYKRLHILTTKLMENTKTSIHREIEERIASLFWLFDLEGAKHLEKACFRLWCRFHPG